MTGRGEGAEARPAPARASGQKAGATKTLPLVLGGGGTLLDPVAALQHLFAVDPVPEEQMATMPLFRHGRAAFTVEGVYGRWSRR